MNTDTSLHAILDGFAELVASKLNQRINGSSLAPGGASKSAVPLRLLTVRQASDYIGRSTDAIYRLIANGTLPAVRSDRRIHLDVRDLDRWIEDNKCRTN